MLDTKQSWDDLVRRHAPDQETKDRILANPLYQNISGKFIQSHDYIAMERLYEIHSEGKFDLIVVDTPPTRNAIDFIEAPQRMAEFFSSRLLRLLIAPYRSRMVNMASRPFYQVADRVLGSQFLEDIAEFFILFQTMYSGFVERARGVERLLRDRRTTFVVVSTLEAAPVREAEFFIKVLTAKKFDLGGLVLNKVLPSYLLDEAAEERAARLMDDGADFARPRAGRGGRHRRGPTGPGSGRDRRELPQLRGGRPAGGRPAPGAAATPRRGGHRPGIRLGHPRSARAAPAGRADLDLGPCLSPWPPSSNSSPRLHGPRRAGGGPPAAAGRRVGGALRPVLLRLVAVRPGRRRPGDRRPGHCDERFVVLGQIRPTTNQTLHLEDLVGSVLGADRPVLSRAWHLGSVVEGEVAIPRRGEPGRLVCIPVRWQGQLVALLTRESALAVGRRPGQLERVYIEVFDRLARMISQGEFPFPVDEVVTAETPRVGDGVLVLDATARIDFASPNAVNALHRMGVYSGIEGVRLEEAGLDETAVSLSYQTRLPATEEVSDGDTALVIRCVPLLDGGTMTAPSSWSET